MAFPPVASSTRSPTGHPSVELQRFFQINEWRLDDGTGDQKPGQLAENRPVIISL